MSQTVNLIPRGSPIPDTLYTELSQKAHPHNVTTRNGSNVKMCAYTSVHFQAPHMKLKAELKHILTLADPSNIQRFSLML